MSKEIWEDRYGAGSDHFMGFSYANDGYWVTFIDNRIEWLGIQELGFPSLEEARTLAGRFLPRDSVYVETYVPEDVPQLSVDVYTSESLIERFDSDWWFGSEPGTFIVVYALFEDGSDMVIATGNNP